jgi:hypothetical protein
MPDLNTKDQPAAAQTGDTGSHEQDQQPSPTAEEAADASQAGRPMSGVFALAQQPHEGASLARVSGDLLQAASFHQDHPRRPGVSTPAEAPRPDSPLRLAPAQSDGSHATLDEILAAIRDQNRRIDALTTRIEGIEARLTGRLAALEARIDGRLAAVIGTMDLHLDDIEESVDRGLESTAATVNSRTALLEHSFSQRLASLEDRQHRSLSALASRIGQPPLAPHESPTPGPPVAECIEQDEPRIPRPPSGRTAR